MEDDHIYDGSSNPTSTQVNTAITDMDTLLEAIKGDAEQAVKDVIIKEIVIEKLNALNNYKRSLGKNTIEPGEPALKVTIDDLKPLHLLALNGSAGKTHPRFTIMDWR